MKVEIIFALDRSGSMMMGQNDYIGGFNAFLADQREIPGECLVTLMQFNETCETVYASQPIAQVEPLTLKTFKPYGQTALYDSLCRLIDETGARLSMLSVPERPDKVIVVILTDGEENASRHYSLEDASARIRHQREIYQWEFIYLGANQDAFTVGKGLGVDPVNTQSFIDDKIGIGQTYSSAGDLVRGMRSK